jgi:bifunctional non-homologous end joining protein LigD
MATTQAAGQAGAPGRGSSLRADAAPGAKLASFPASFAPMMATLVDEPFSDPEWIFEPKHDGIRTIALLEGGRARLISRRGNDQTREFPALAAALARLADRAMILDGEIAALGPDGVTSFQRLQPRLGLESAADIARADETIPALFFVFDLTYLDGYDLTGVPLEYRKALLGAVVRQSELLRMVEPLAGRGEELFRWAVARRMEGLVAKHRASPYRPGQRSDQWLKIKGKLTDEFVIGGYSQGLRARESTFGALLLGQYEDGRLVYTGHVGTGFTRELLAELKAKLDALKCDQPPFAFGEVPYFRTPVTWIRPELVGEVKFVEWTRDRRLRAPVFLRLRPDKPASEVRRQAVAEAPG